MNLGHFICRMRRNGWYGIAYIHLVSDYSNTAQDVDIFVLCFAITVNPDGRLDTSRAAEIHFQNVSSLHATALNLSNRTTQNGWYCCTSSLYFHIKTGSRSKELATEYLQPYTLLSMLLGQQTMEVHQAFLSASKFEHENFLLSSVITLLGLFSFWHICSPCSCFVVDISLWPLSLLFLCRLQC